MHKSWGIEGFIEYRYRAIRTVDACHVLRTLHVCHGYVTFLSAPSTPWAHNNRTANPIDAQEFALYNGPSNREPAHERAASYAACSAPPLPKRPF